MIKKTSGLLFKFAVIFGIFTVVTLVMSGISTYFNQMDAYKKECEQNIRNIGEYLDRLMQSEGEDFILYQQYYMEHFAEVDIPYDFSDFQDAKIAFEELFVSRYPGKVFRKDISFEDLDEDVKKAYFIDRHEYWLLTFEKAREAFNIPYTYYLVPKEEQYIMVYMIDGERTHKNMYGLKSDEGEFLYLGDEYYDDPAVYTVQWDAWFSGKPPSGYQVWDNEWGHTYAYYTPLFIGGKKLGLIGTEIEVATVNKGILRNVLIQGSCSGIILILFVTLVLLVLNFKYISRLVHLQADVREYAALKNSEIATGIRRWAKGDDEISALARQFAIMILEIEEYMNNLLSTAQELSSTKKKAAEMNELAHKDALTGVRNKISYDSEVRRIEWALADGFVEFGIVMIDLNFLKRINDSYGHEQGNVAIKKLCSIVCDIFKHSPIFRIGGDEFVVILENTDYKNIDSLSKKFNEDLDNIKSDETLEPWERISAAIGIALYDPAIDSRVSNVFKRADRAMYTRKKEMKAVREN